jgi:hypothetical protein
VVVIMTDRCELWSGNTDTSSGGEPCQTLEQQVSDTQNERTLVLLLFAQLHLFDGLAMLTKLRVSNGRVWGSQKYVESEQYRWALSARDTLQKEVICKYFWTCFCD